jgi:ATP-dependent RNA circularization protein (DNA/RNA ligase family)
MKYPKINTLFMRDDKNIIIPSEYTEEVFKDLEQSPWECTEKIDGTNIRIFLDVSGDALTVSFQGRTDDSIIPAHLLAYLTETFTTERLCRFFDEQKLRESGEPVILYGEGYGQKIQTPGKRYRKDSVSFILFDVRVGKFWFTRETLEQVAEAVGIDIVPLVGYYTIPEAIELVSAGFKSSLAEDKTLDAEGLVLKTRLGLLDRAGNRIITKLKTTDFAKYRRVRGGA